MLTSILKNVAAMLKEATDERVTLTTWQMFVDINQLARVNEQRISPRGFARD
jgi:hypothetical protein